MAVPQQRTLDIPPNGPPGGLPEGPPPLQPAVDVAPIWLQRLSLIVLVLFCLYIGGMLTVMPWLPRFWDHNSLLTSFPAARAFLNHSAVRGIVSGIGLIDIWIGISELLHYRDFRA